MKKYLFLASLAYAFPILRPLQRAIRQRGDQVAWFFDELGAQYLDPGEIQLQTIHEVFAYNPIAVFTTGNHIYDFFPGIKVQLFHGFNIDKRPGRGDHFSIKGLFDLYCTQGETSTERFQELAEAYGYFKVVETGWPRVDDFFRNGPTPLPKNPRPVILYSSTFTTWITSAPYLYDEIRHLIQTKPWDWLLTLHPKTDPETVEHYRALEIFDNVHFYNSTDNTELLKKADVMVCDSSSIIVEFLILNKPVVTFKNTSPGPHVMDIQDPKLLAPTIEQALTRPDELLQNIRKYVHSMNPYYDGKSSERVLNAVDWFIANYKGRLKHKPLNLVRRYQLRKKLHFPLFKKLNLL